ncbi:hypothetical protein [Streptomyces sp. NBC_00304]|uniref:hypothetical protein n=1 Tax=Streptomyces sp. NBC_00304 TaxID=2975706 RepID=UPI002E2B07F6|nr:hypothetical protein [Streptomyces sp. NBC_00304]
MTDRIRIHARRHAAVLAVAAALVTALAGCSEATTSQGPGADVPQVAPSVYESAEAAAEPAGDEAGDAEAGGDAAAYTTPGPEKVRDAFAGLQATLQETCTPGAGDCAYFLGRVNEELTGMEASMKVDPQGPGHFKEPLGWTATLRTVLAGDTSTANLEKHFKDLVSTRDRINSWMRGHPEDYR